MAGAELLLKLTGEITPNAVVAPVEGKNQRSFILKTFFLSQYEHIRRIDAKGVLTISDLQDFVKSFIEDSYLDDQTGEHKKYLSEWNRARILEGLGRCGLPTKYFEPRVNRIIRQRISQEISRTRKSNV